MKIDHPDINYLMTQPIGEILIKGLGQTFLKKPQFPIDFLGKWLLNYNASKQEEIKFKSFKRNIEDFKIEEEMKAKKL